MRLIILSRKTVLYIALGIILFLFAVVYLVLSNPETAVLEVTSAAERRLPIYSVDTGEKAVALTFDATWGATRTPKILEILRKKNAEATFFLTNIWMEDYPEKTREIWREGHEIGLHSASHPDMTTIARSEIRSELESNLNLVVKLCPTAEPRLFRPPFGAYNDFLIEVAEDELGFTTIQWSIDSLDWQNVSSDYIVNRIDRLLHPGAIILMHNDGENTPRALAEILDILEERDYRTVPVSKLLYSPPYRIDHRGRQIKTGRNISCLAFYRTM